jgi:hypothetical protein
VLLAVLVFSSIVMGSVLAGQFHRQGPFSPTGVLLALGVLVALLLVVMPNRHEHDRVALEDECMVISKWGFLGSRSVRLPLRNTHLAVLRSARDEPGHLLLVSSTTCVSAKIQLKRRASCSLVGRTGWE